MATGMTTYLKTQIVTHLLRTGSWTKPTGIYIALFTDQPTVSGGGTEVSGGSYARVSFGPLDANWTALTSSASKNDLDVVFPQPTGSWGTVSHFALFDAASAGNMLVFGELLVASPIDAASAPPTFATAQLTVNLA